MFDVGSYKCLATFVGHEREISKGTFNPSGKRVATASSDKTVRIWDINSGKCLQVLFYLFSFSKSNVFLKPTKTLILIESSHDQPYICQYCLDSS